MNMSATTTTDSGKLKTTVIGSFRKPTYLSVPSFVDQESNAFNKEHLDKFNQVASCLPATDLAEQVERAVKETIALQLELGIDVLTDGEMRRDDYMFDYMRRHEGFDFVNTEECSLRNGAYTAKLPCIRSPVVHRTNAIADEWRASQNYSPQAPVKYTIPGPMTITGTCKNNYYQDERLLSADLVKCINADVLALVAAGCKQIQIDEPLLMRRPEVAMEYGIAALTECLKGVPSDVETTVHMCCGYPQYLDQNDYMKADPNCYSIVAEKLDAAGFSAISFEDSHRRNDPSVFKKYTKSTIILGVLEVASSRVESVQEIKQHILDVMEVVPRHRLIIAPDCGLPFLPDDVMRAKLVNMVQAANSV